MAAEGRLAYAALAFGIAAAFSSWNPLAAPFGLVVGLATTIVSVRAIRRGGRRPLAAAGLALSVLAVVASALGLALTAGLGRDPAGEAVVAGPSREEGSRTLDAAAARTQQARERAARELDAAEGGSAGEPPRDGAPRR
jgi:hypothetical protein